ncbi:MAG: type II toxin-antitoxin system VapC family toxin [Mycobacteriales bacterium]
MLNVLLWWVGGEDAKLSRPAMDAITVNLAEGEVVISSISAWEISALATKGKLALSMPISDWLSTVAAIERVRFCSVDNDIAIHSTDLPGEFHKDPADRMIVATARHLNVPLLTADKKILAYEHVKTIW